MHICVFVYLENDTKSNVQRQFGAVAIFLAWINFTYFLKRFQTYGIYIIMAKKIFLTFIKVRNFMEAFLVGCFAALARATNFQILVCIGEE